MNKVTLILTYQCNYWFVCKTIILKSEKYNLVLKEIKLKVSLIYLETAKTRKNKIEQSSAPVPPSFPKLADSISFNCAFEPDAEDTAVEGHAPEMERNKEKRTQGEMLCFKTCASWLQWKEMALPDDDRRWQIGVRARGARATGVVFGGAKWALVRRVERAAAELVVEQQPTRQLKLKLMKSTGTCVPKTERGEEAKEANEVNEAKSLPEERGEETRSVRPGGAATNKATSVDSGSLTDCLWWWCVCMAITERYYRATRSSHKLGMAQISDMYARRERMVLVVVGSSSHGVEGVIVWVKHAYKMSADDRQLICFGARLMDGANFLARRN